MTRPCFLVVDHEHFGNISTRKLVLEAAKFNVITAYSANEAIATLTRFPSVDGIVTDAELPGMLCTDLIKAFKLIAPKAPVILVRRPMFQYCEGADYQLDSFDPRVLLEMLERICPNQISAIEKHEEKLEEEGA